MKRQRRFHMYAEAPGFHPGPRLPSGWMLIQSRGLCSSERNVGRVLLLDDPPYAVFQGA